MINKFIFLTVLLAFSPIYLCGAESNQAQPTPTATPQHSLETVAAAMQVSVSVAAEARALNIDERLSFIVMRLTLRCGCSPAAVFAQRRTLSWGELCEAYGLSWTEALKDIQARMLEAGIEAEPATAEQLLRSGSNLPDELPRPQETGKLP